MGQKERGRGDAKRADRRRSDVFKGQNAFSAGIRSIPNRNTPSIISTWARIIAILSHWTDSQLGIAKSTQMVGTLSEGSKPNYREPCAEMVFSARRNQKARPAWGTRYSNCPVEFEGARCDVARW